MNLDRVKYYVKCRICGYEWLSAVSNRENLTCPKCKARGKRAFKVVELNPNEIKMLLLKWIEERGG